MDAGQKRRGWRGFARGGIAPALVAMALGYFLAGRIDWSRPDRSAASRRIAVMNTEASIVVPADSGSSLTPGRLADLAEEAIREVDELMGPAGENSDIRRLNAAPANAWIEVSPLTWTVVMEALRWHRLSGGAFDPTIGPVKSLFAFDGRDTDAWPDAEALAAAKRLVGADKLLFEREGMRLAWAVDGMRLDLGAIAKGFAVDRAIETLAANGARNALVEIGGEIRTMGVKPGSPPLPWTAGIQNPRGDGAIRLPDVGGKAIATSGDASQYALHRGKRYGHVIDPRSGLPLEEGVASVSVIHPESCMAADALATTMCVLGRKEGRDFLSEQALSLFRRGVSVVMFDVRADGPGRVDFVVDEAGALSESESASDFPDSPGPDGAPGAGQE